MKMQRRWFRVAILALLTLLVSGALLSPAALAEGSKRDAAMRRSTALLFPAVIKQPPSAAPEGAIEGVVFQDWNQNGIHDAGEPTLAGATVSLLVQNGGNEGYWAKVGHVVTDWDGRFCFDALDPARPYLVVGSAPLGYSSLAPTETMVQPIAGETTWLSFGYVLLLRAPLPEALP